MKTLERQLADYGARQRELHGPIVAAELQPEVRNAVVNAPYKTNRLPRLLAGLAGAAATLLLGFGLISWLTGGDSPPDVGASTTDPSATVVGLPPDGATPSDPTPGELVLQLEGNLTVPGMIWIYADGRVITQRPLSAPEGVGDEFSGLTERRLTPEGVEFLRSEVIATGLFTGDLMLARDGNAPFLMIHVWNGDRLASVTWAWRGIAGDAPVATPEQEDALRALNALLTSLESLPSDLWEDRTLTAYVPSSYSVCFGVSGLDIEPGYWLGPVDPTLVWALLPEPAEDLLRAGVATEERSMHQDGGCSRMPTDDARTLALILQEAGISRVVSSGIFWPETYQVAFTLPSQGIVSDQGVTADEVFIQFGPVLPHGEAVWWGPG